MRLIPALVGVAGIAMVALGPIGLARAQWVNPYTGTNWNNPGSSLLDTMIRNRMFQETMRKHASGQGKGDAASAVARPETASAATTAARPAKPAKPVKHRPMTVTDYKPAKGHLLPTSLGGSADEQALMVSLLDQALAGFTGKVRPNNLAWGLVFVVSACLYVERGVDLADDATEAWAVEVNDLMAADPKFRKLKPADRQLLNEYFVLSGTVLLVLDQQGKQQGDQQQIAHAKKLARGFLDQFGIE